MIRRVSAIAWAVMTDALRRKVVWIVAVFAVVMVIGIPLLPSYGVGVAQQVFKQVAQSLMYLAAAVLALVLSANRVPSEIERRTVFNVLARETRRWEYLTGTWLGIFGVLAASIAAFCVFSQAAGLVIYGEAMWVLWEGAAAVLLECGVLSAFAVAVSTRTGPVTVSVAAFAFLFVGHTGGSIGLLLPASVLKYLPSLDMFGIAAEVAHGSGVGAARFVVMAVAFVVWVVLLLGAGTAAFSGRDL